jgi:hypothetical protein
MTSPQPLGKKATGGHWNSGIAVLRNNRLDRSSRTQNRARPYYSGDAMTLPELLLSVAGLLGFVGILLVGLARTRSDYLVGFVVIAISLVFVSVVFE